MTALTQFTRRAETTSWAAGSMIRRQTIGDIIGCMSSQSYLQMKKIQHGLLSVMVDLASIPLR